MLLTGCEQFEFSPYQTKQGGKEHIGLNATNIFQAAGRTPVIRSCWYSAGTSSVFITRLTGWWTTSMTCTGRCRLSGWRSDRLRAHSEFGWLNESLLRLQCPFIAVIGNHDCLANGTELFERTYGPLINISTGPGSDLFCTTPTAGSFHSMDRCLTSTGCSAVEDTSAYRASIFLFPISKPFDKAISTALEDAYVQCCAAPAPIIQCTWT